MYSVPTSRLVQHEHVHSFFFHIPRTVVNTKNQVHSACPYILNLKRICASFSSRLLEIALIFLRGVIDVHARSNGLKQTHTNTHTPTNSVISSCGKIQKNKRKVAAQRLSGRRDSALRWIYVVDATREAADVLLPLRCTITGVSCFECDHRFFFITLHTSWRTNISHG